MPENISEHTTSIAGLTCKPLAIISKTISPQEMSMARGGIGLDETRVSSETSTHPLDQALNPQPESRGTLSTDHPDNYVAEIYDLDEPDNRPPPVSDVPFIITQDDYYDDENNNDENNNDENNNDENGQNNYESFWDFDFLDDDDDGNCEYCDDENCDGDCANDDDDENGSGVPDEENSTESTEGNNG